MQRKRTLSGFCLHLSISGTETRHILLHLTQRITYLIFCVQKFRLFLGQCSSVLAPAVTGPFFAEIQITFCYSVSSFVLAHARGPVFFRDSDYFLGQCVLLRACSCHTLLTYKLLLFCPPSHYVLIAPPPPT